MEYTGAQIVVSAVTKAFPDANGTPRVVLKELSWRLSGPHFVSLIGPNGCGKTSFLNLLAGLISPDSGSVEITKQDGTSPKIGYVWQNYRASLLPWLDVGENIAFPLRMRGIGRNRRREIVEPLLSEFLPSVNASDRCYSLSGGQQQLISVLRSTTIEPDVMLLDEPFSALDQQRSWDLALHLERIWRNRPIPTVFVSHDVDEAILLADMVVLMSSSGQICGCIDNKLPRPRTIAMLTSAEHLRCRHETISFFAEQRLNANGESKT